MKQPSASGCECSPMSCARLVTPEAVRRSMTAGQREAWAAQTGSALRAAQPPHSLAMSFQRDAEALPPCAGCGAEIGDDEDCLTVFSKTAAQVRAEGGPLFTD